MGRAERRARARGIQRKQDGSMSFKQALRVANAIEAMNINLGLKPGDKVRINVEQIKKSANYKHYNEPYRQFIEEHQHDVFTLEAIPDNNLKNVFQLAEDTSDPKWFFCGLDLSKLAEVKEPDSESNKAQPVKVEAKAEQNTDEAGFAEEEDELDNDLDDFEE